MELQALVEEAKTVSWFNLLLKIDLLPPFFPLYNLTLVSSLPKHSMRQAMPAPPSQFKSDSMPSRNRVQGG